MSAQVCFEDFSVGDRVRTPARTITEADIAVFAALAGDASGSVAPGLHALSLSVVSPTGCGRGSPGRAR